MHEKAQALRAILVRQAKTRRIVITGHDRADVDSVVSCVLMGRLLEAWGIPFQIVLFEPDR